MESKIFKSEGFYIIKINNILDEKALKKALDKVLELRGIKEVPYKTYSIYYTEDYTYCLIDFTHRKLKDNDIERIIRHLKNSENVSIIKIDNIHDELLVQEAIHKVLESSDILNRPYVAYSIYYTKDNAYCLIDFNHKKLSDDDVEEVINSMRK